MSLPVTDGVGIFLCVCAAGCAAKLIFDDGDDKYLIGIFVFLAIALILFADGDLSSDTAIAAYVLGGIAVLGTIYSLWSWKKASDREKAKASQ